METLADAFADGTVGAQWSITGSVTESDGTAVIPCTAAYPSLYSAATYDLTGSHLHAWLAPPPPGTGTRETLMQTKLDGNNYLEWYSWNGDAYARYKVGGATTTLGSVTESASAWRRIRNAGGICYWDTSGDGVTWANRFSVANPFAVTALTALFSSGFYGTEGAANLLVDNVDVQVGSFPSAPLDTAVELRLGSAYVWSAAAGGLTGEDTGAYVYSPDASAYDVTGDVDIRIDVTAVDWTPIDASGTPEQTLQLGRSALA